MDRVTLVLLVIMFLFSCKQEKPEPEAEIIHKTRAENFEVTLDLWLECRTKCGGPGTNWAVDKDFCTCRRGIRIQHSESKENLIVLPEDEIHVPEKRKS